jgi:hypothetical protein
MKKRENVVLTFKAVGNSDVISKTN